MKRTLLFLLPGILIFTSCCKQTTKQSEPVNLAQATLMATLYQQQAAEYKALCYQAYNLASLKLSHELNLKHDKALAVVVDIDETVLDNSPYQAESILKNWSYPTGWADWMYMASAEAVPGAVGFLQEAASNKVEVFYISNRKAEFSQATLDNLKQKGFPFADTLHLMPRTSTNDKEQRRLKVLENFEVILYVGDNLGDFSSVFDTSDAGVRSQNTESNRHYFGNRWIVLPNACYGVWVSALPDYSTKISADSLMKVYHSNLKGF